MGRSSDWGLGTKAKHAKQPSHMPHPDESDSWKSKGVKSKTASRFSQRNFSRAAGAVSKVEKLCSVPSDRQELACKDFSDIGNV